MAGHLQLISLASLQLSSASHTYVASVQHKFFLFQKMERLNAFAKCDFKPKITVNDLIINEWYEVVGMKKIKTAFGDTILVELTESVLFLPKRMLAVLTKSAIDDLLSGSGCLIRYIGQKKVGNNTTPANQFEFSKAH